MIFGLIAAALALGGLAALAWSAIQGWIEQNRTERTLYSETIREKLDSGNYRVVVAVVDRSHRWTAEKTWTEATLDEEMEDRFGHSNTIRVYY
jgi:hypothetical protein